MPIPDPSNYSYLEVACSQCGAAVHRYCQRPSGHSGPIVEPHQPRRAAAHDQWRAEEIARYGQQLTPWPDDPQVVAAPVTPSRQLTLF